MTELTIVDNTILTAMASCPTLTGIRHVLGLTMPEDRAPLRAGSLAHAILAHYLAGKPIAEAFTLPDVISYMEWATGAVELNDRLSSQNVLKIMHRWIETHPLSGLPFRPPDPNLVEVGFAVPLTDDIVFVGRMDALVRDETGAAFVLEHKTTGRLDESWRRRWRSAAQITGYVWAAQEHLHVPVAGCFVNGIEFGRLPTDVKKCRSHNVPYAECGTLHARFDMLIEHRAPHQLEAWRQDAIKLARRFQALKLQVGSLADIKDVPMFGQLTGACVYCQFADFCAVGRPAATGTAMMVHEPWEPFAHAMQP